MHTDSLPAKILRLGSLTTTIAMKNRRALRAVFGNALATAESVADPKYDVSALPEITVESIIERSGKDINVALRTVPAIRASISLHEGVCLAVLMRSIEARQVFEFGTYRGVSTAQIALNLAPGGQLHTLDLPLDNVTTTFDLKAAGELEFAQDARKGDMIPCELRPRITFLHQDSAQFDPNPYENAMDFVFVDGAHTLEYVRNDSEKGWRMLRPGGIICWHDCRHNSPGVAQYLLQSPWRPTRIVGGTVAFAVKDQ